MRSPRSHAQRSVAAQLPEVEMMPPRSPTNALMAADELMYVTGMTARPGAIGVPIEYARHRELFPAGLELIDRGHVGHRAAGRQVRQDHFLVRHRQHVGALRHEMDAAEHDELGVGMLRHLAGQAERVAGVVGELDDLVALIVMAENNDALPQRSPGVGDAAVEFLVGQSEISLRQRLTLADV